MSTPLAPDPAWAAILATDAEDEAWQHAEALRDRAREHAPASHLSLPQTGGAVTTTAEARGMTQRDSEAAVSSAISVGESGRAAGALLTGQRQSGLSQAPATMQHPGGTHGVAGSSFPEDRAHHPARPARSLRDDPTPPNAAPPSPQAPGRALNTRPGATPSERRS